MILTVAEFDETGEVLDEGLRHVAEEVVPAVSGAGGLAAGYWVVDRENGKRLSVMLWDSPEAMAAAMPGVSAKITQQREAAGRATQSSPNRTARYEVVVSV